MRTEVGCRPTLQSMDALWKPWKARIGLTRQAAGGIGGQPGEEEVSQPVELDLVLHAEALEALPGIEQIPAGAAYMLAVLAAQGPMQQRSQGHNSFCLDVQLL